MGTHLKGWWAQKNTGLDWLNTEPRIIQKGVDSRLFPIANQYLGLILGNYCEDYVEERGELGGGY